MFIICMEFVFIGAPCAEELDKVSKDAAGLLNARKKSIVWFRNQLELSEDDSTARSSEVFASEVKAVLCAWIGESDGNDREKLASLLRKMNLSSCSFALKTVTRC